MPLGAVAATSGGPGRWSAASVVSRTAPESLALESSSDPTIRTDVQATLVRMAKRAPPFQPMNTPPCSIHAFKRLTPSAPSSLSYRPGEPLTKMRTL